MGLWCAGSGAFCSNPFGFRVWIVQGLSVATYTLNLKGVLGHFLLVWGTPSSELLSKLKLRDSKIDAPYDGTASHFHHSRVTKTIMRQAKRLEVRV